MKAVQAHEPPPYEQRIAAWQVDPVRACAIVHVEAYPTWPTVNRSNA